MPGFLDEIHLPSLAQLRQRAEQAGARLGTNLTQTTITPNVDVNGKPEHEAETPIMEHPNMRYNAYRGAEMHGVAPGSPWDGGPQGFTDGTVDVHWDHSDPGAAVVPVRIVKNPEEEIRQWRTGGSIAPVSGSTPVMVVGKNRQRTKLRVKNSTTGASLLQIMHDPDGGAYNFFPLSPGESVDLDTSEAVFAVSSDANTCPVSFIWEFVEPVDVQ